jgi:copper transport protein
LVELSDPLRLIALSIARFSGFAAHAVLFGLVPVVLLVLRPALARLGEGWEMGRSAVGERLEALTQAALVASAAATALTLLLQAALVGEVTGADITKGSFQSVLSTSFGRWHLLRLPLLVGLVVLLWGRVRTWAVAAAAPRALWWAAWGLLATGLLATSALSGHAAVSQPLALAIASDLLHFAAGAAWFAGIVCLTAVLPSGWRGRSAAERLELLVPAVLRFSRVALVAILVAGATGTVNTLLQLGEPDDLIDTPYGRTLLAKICLYGVILALGGINHLYLRHRLVAGPDRRGHAVTFRRVVRAEAAVGLVILALTGLLTGLARTKQYPIPPGQPVSVDRST